MTICSSHFARQNTEGPKQHYKCEVDLTYFRVKAKLHVFIRFDSNMIILVWISFIRPFRFQFRLPCY